MYFTQGWPLQLIRKKISITARIITAVKSTVQTIAQVFFSCKRFMCGYLSMYIDAITPMAAIPRPGPCTVGQGSDIRCHDPEPK
jgi:hypothetical protein